MQTRRTSPISGVFRPLSAGGLTLSLCAMGIPGCADIPVSGAEPTSTYTRNSLPDGGVLARGKDASASDVSSDARGLPDSPVSDDDWKRRTAPVTGPHDIEWFSSLGCPVQPIEQDYRILPTVICRARRGTPTVRDCDVEPYCTRHEECKGKPHGRCRGAPSERCVYPTVTREPCTVASDCKALPNGSCPIVQPQTYCYPSGLCELPARTCTYREEPCSRDAECVTLPGGICEKRILLARCEYLDCEEDDHCQQGERCACSTANAGNSCVPADCASDRDCPSGQTCRLEIGCNGYATGYHCSTPLDTCKWRGDCPLGYCLFKGRWQCEIPICPPVGP